MKITRLIPKEKKGLVRQMMGEEAYVSAPLLRIGEAAKYLGIGRKMVYQLIELGEVRAVKVGRSVRIEKRSLDQFKASGRSI